jgi:hypothetical protein
MRSKWRCTTTLVARVGAGSKRTRGDALHALREGEAPERAARTAARFEPSAPIVKCSAISIAVQRGAVRVHPSTAARRDWISRVTVASRSVCPPEPIDTASLTEDEACRRSPQRTERLSLVAREERTRERRDRGGDHGVLRQRAAPRAGLTPLRRGRPCSCSRSIDRASRRCRGSRPLPAFLRPGSRR